MSTITTINASDTITASRAVLNTNLANLNTDKIETSVLDTDTALAANSDAKVATQKAVKAYVDAGGNVNASTSAKGIVEEATAAEVVAGTAAGGTGARLFMNPSTAGTKFSSTQVFSGNAPAAFTDLDLSAVVGALTRMVVLKFTNGAATTLRVHVRKNGDSEASTTSASTYGANSGSITAASGQAIYLICNTDTAGIVEWIGSDAHAVTVNVVAYW